MLALLVKKRSLKLKSGAAGLKPAGCDVSLQTSVPVTKEDLNRLLGHSRPAAKDRSRRHGPHLKECPERGSSKPVSRQGSIWDGADSVEEALRSMKLYPGVSADLNAPPWLRILRPGWGSAVFKFAER